MKFLDKIDGLNKFKSFLILIGVLLTSLIIVYIPFMVRGNYLVWVDMAKDSMTQGVTYLEHVKNNGYVASIGNYDYWIGLGADYLTSLSFFSLFDPFNLIYFILPFNPLLSYSITMAFKSLSCGIIFYIFIKDKGVSNSKAIMLSIMYMLTGFVCFTFVRHYNLTAGPIYFPLIIMGVERAYDGKRPYLLIISLFLCLITNFYVFFSATILSVLYIFIRHFVLVKQEKVESGFKCFIKKFSYLAFLYLIAVFLASFMLLPNLYGYINAARSASKGYPMFEPSVFLNNLETFLFPVQAPRYGHMYLNIAILIMGICAVFTKSKETKPYRIIVVILTAGFLIPAFGYAMNIFNYCNNRWSYALSFFIFALIGMNSKNEEVSYNDNNKRKTNAVLLCYFGLIAIAAILSLVASLNYGWHLLWGVIACIVVCGLICLLIKHGKCLDWFKKFYKQSILFPLATIISIGYCFQFYINYSASFNVKPVYDFLYTEQEKYVASKNENEFFRTDAEYNETWFGSFDNRPVNNEYMGTHSYNSISNKYVYEFLKENGVYNPPQNLGMFGFNGRSLLQSLTSVKYTYCENGLYYGFNQVDNQENLYENENFNSFGFVLNKTISREKYMSLNVIDRQFALLDGVVVDEAEELTDIDPLNKDYYSEVYPAEFSKEINNKTKYHLENVLDKEVYLVVEGVKEVGSLSTVKFSCNGIEKEYSFYQKGNLMYSDTRDFYLNFGVQKTDEIVIDASMIKGTKIEAENVKIVTINKQYIDEYLHSTKGLDRMYDVVFNNKGIKGKINCNSSGYLFFSIPYSDGWRLYIDGKEQKLYRADTAFMASKIDLGIHDIELKYETPFLNSGKILSLGSIVVLFVTCLGYEITKFKTEKNKRETD